VPNKTSCVQTYPLAATKSSSLFLILLLDAAPLNPQDRIYFVLT